MTFDQYTKLIGGYNKKWMRSDAPFYVMKLSEECGEVAEAAIAALGSTSKIDKLNKKGISPGEALEEELGDVLNVIITIGTSFGITPEQIINAAGDKINFRMAKKEKESCQAK
jgi:NTP pyrophosphatase (non-canonical NTP hydrolase)